MKIQVLPPEVCQKIAAGEVIERPASVLKELVENGLDAGAGVLRAEVRQAGKQLVKVSDDGLGMAPEDVPLAFERFATSKIFQEQDIYTVRTFGFRGEALPSIASVSRVKLVTRERGALFGTEARVEGGRLASLQEVGAPVGTTVEVWDLFFNTPARRKFLRSLRTEYSHIVGTFTRFALAFPDKSFFLLSDSREIYALPPSSTQERIASLFGQELASSLEAFEAEGTLGRVWGYVSSSPWPWNRYYLFVNHRAVKSPTLYRAIRDALSGRGMVFLFLELHPSQVDVNIHPSKTEVRFRDEERIYELVRASLERRVFQAWREASQVAEGAERYGAGRERGFLLLGQLEETFLLAFSGGHLYVIDQHAASERVVYEKLVAEQGKGGRVSRELLAPRVVVLSPGEREVLEARWKELEACGFSIEPFGPQAYAIRSAPAFLDPREAEIILKRLIGRLQEAARSHRAEDVAQALSCLAAIKGGRGLSREEQERLLQEWSNAPNPHACVHNRPIYFRLSLDEVRRKVGRTGLSCEPTERIEPAERLEDH